MKKHLILLKAMELYPFGAKFKSIAHNEECVSSGVFYFNEESESINSGLLTKVDNIGRYVYRNGIWAEIVKPKIAVKVENEKEFHALMKYYDSMGYKHWNDNAKFVMGEYVEFQNDFAFLLEGQQKDFEVFSFSDFAKEHNIKLPLLKSEDCVWLYEGDRFYRTYFSNGKWEFNSDWSLVNDSYVITHPDEFKAFSTKQASLEWTEAQKPKEIILFEKDEVSAVVTKHKVKFNPTTPELLNKWDGFIVSANELEQIYNAYKELS